MGICQHQRALNRESQQLLEAKAATQRADANVELSLEALQNIFATLAQHKEPASLESVSPGISKMHWPLVRPKMVSGRSPDEAHGPDSGLQDPIPAAEKEEFDAALLQTVLKFYDRFAEQNPTDPKLQVVAAAAFSRRGGAASPAGRVRCSGHGI